MLAPAAIASDSVRDIKRDVDDYVFAEANGTVQSGPFTGMTMCRDLAWKEARLAPLVLGCYEEELHGVLEQQIARLKGWQRNPHIVVVGASEGYYAIGLKLRVPKADVYALDIDDDALAICRRNADLNGVELIIGAPLDEVFRAPDLIVMDCEGAEIAYLDFEKFPALAAAHIIVEIHNFPGRKTDDLLLERFRGTHRIDLLVEGPRNPNRFKELVQMSSDQRWLAISENRPCLMGWFSMTPRGLNAA